MVASSPSRGAAPALGGDPTARVLEVWVRGEGEGSPAAKIARQIGLRRSAVVAARRRRRCRGDSTKSVNRRVSIDRQRGQLVPARTSTFRSDLLP